MRHNTCPRCSGRLFTERGTGYTEMVCLQCGYRRPDDDGGVTMAKARAPQAVPPRAA